MKIIPLDDIVLQKRRRRKILYLTAFDDEKSCKYNPFGRKKIKKIKKVIKKTLVSRIKQILTYIHGQD